jgi:dienelactone hydrolase
MAESVKALVLMPDFFKGEPLPLSIYPPDTDEKMQMAKAFMTKVDIGWSVEKLVEVVKEAKGKEEFGGVKSWGAYGLCWGGKVRCPQHL